MVSQPNGGMDTPFFIFQVPVVVACSVPYAAFNNDNTAGFQ